MVSPYKAPRNNYTTASAQKDIFMKNNTGLKAVLIAILCLGATTVSAAETEGVHASQPKTSQRPSVRKSHKLNSVCPEPLPEISQTHRGLEEFTPAVSSGRPRTQSSFSEKEEEEEITAGEPKTGHHPLKRASIGETGRAKLAPAAHAHRASVTHDIAPGVGTSDIRSTIWNQAYGYIHFECVLPNLVIPNSYNIRSLPIVIKHREEEFNVHIINGRLFTYDAIEGTQRGEIIKGVVYDLSNNVQEGFALASTSDRTCLTYDWLRAVNDYTTQVRNEMEKSLRTGEGNYMTIDGFLYRLFMTTTTVFACYKENACSTSEKMPLALLLLHESSSHRFPHLEGPESAPWWWWHWCC